MNKDDAKVTIVTAKNGRRYAYKATGHAWDKERKYCKTKLEYYGTVDEEGNVIPKRRKLVRATLKEAAPKEEKLSLVSQSRVGMTRTLSRISTDIGLTGCLEECFPRTWETLLSISFYHAASGMNTAYLFPSWLDDHECPISGKAITGQDMSRLYDALDDGRRLEFLKKWRNAASTGAGCFHDITSISSYSKDNELVEYGYNRDKEDLPQINLAMVVDSGNRLPVYYRVHDGSIGDVSTLRTVLKQGFCFNMKKLTFVMDKGFFSDSNVGLMYSFGYHFIVSMNFSSGKAKDAVDAVRDRIRHPMNLIKTLNGERLYATAVPGHWNGEGLDRACRFHVFTKDVVDISVRSANLDVKLRECYEELNRGEFHASHAAFYARYFEEKANEDGTKSYGWNEKNLAKRETKYSGFLVIVTDRLDLTSTEIIDIYRDKDGVEKVFDDTKNAQDQKRLGIHNHRTLEGKMFILFITAILISEIRQRMGDYKGKDWTMDSIRKALDKITLSKVSYNSMRKPRDLYSDVTSQARQMLSCLLKVKECDAVEQLMQIIV